MEKGGKGGEGVRKTVSVKWTVYLYEHAVKERAVLKKCFLICFVCIFAPLFTVLPLKELPKQDVTVRTCNCDCTYSFFFSFADL